MWFGQRNESVACVHVNNKIIFAPPPLLPPSSSPPPLLNGECSRHFECTLCSRKLSVWGLRGPERLVLMHVSVCKVDLVDEIRFCTMAKCATMSLRPISFRFNAIRGSMILFRYCVNWICLLFFSICPSINFDFLVRIYQSERFGAKIKTWNNISHERFQRSLWMLVIRAQ